MYTLYTDGACAIATTRQGGIGIVFLKDDKLILEYSKSFERVTNNQMELIAIIYGLRMVKQPIDKLQIRTDSMYCIGCISQGWKRKKNEQLWKLFDTELARVKELCPEISIQHVKGHENNKWNNRCDLLASQASKMLLPK